jgi:hypothetical protein
MRRSVLATIGLAVFGAAVVACSLLVPLNDVQCNTDGDCAARGAGFSGAVCVSNVCLRPVAEASDDEGGAEAGTDAPAEAAAIDASGPWGCLQVPPEPSNGNATSDVQILVFDAFSSYTLGGAVDGGSDLHFVQGTVEPGVSVQQCQPLDYSCTTSPVITTDDSGIADFPDTNGAFDGYYLTQQTGSFPALFYPGRVIETEPHMQFPTSLLPYTEAAGLGDAIGVTVSTSPDAGLGHIFMLALDCMDHHAAGVSFALNVDAGTEFYQQGGLPVVPPEATQTDSDGTGGFINIPFGVIKVTATINTQNTLTLPVYTVFVRPGGQTLVYLRPKSR